MARPESLESRRLLTTGVFLDQTIEITGFRVRVVDVDIADFNGDGRPDLVAAVVDSSESTDRYTARVFLGTGDGQFEVGKDSVIVATSVLRTGDFNNDGHPDLATFEGQPSGPNEQYFATIYRGDGAGAFETEQQFIIASKYPSDVVVNDLDRDGNLDLAVAVEANNHVSIFRGQGDGTFGPAELIATGEQPRSMTTADFNADGVTDLAVANISSNDVSVLLGAGDGTFTAQRVSVLGNVAQPRSILAGDLDGDGIQDLIVENAQNLTVLLGKGDGSFDRRLSIEQDVAATLLADVNQDGIADVISSGEHDAFGALLGNGDGTFQDARPYINPSVTKPGDLNGDGYLDFVGPSAEGISIVLGHADGTLGNKQHLSLRNDGSFGNTVDSLVAHDFNHDGVSDLVISNATENTIELRIGSREGGFEPGQFFDVDTQPGRIAVGDFNGDGLEDLATGSYMSQNVSVLLGDENGYFGSPQTFETTAAVYNLAVEDINADGLSDLVIANLHSDVVTIFLGMSNGTLASPADLAIGDYRNLTVADLSGDGVPDLAITQHGEIFSQIPATVAILIGNGDGTFGEPRTHEVGSWPNSIVSGDFNSDGVVDLATANTRTNTISLLLGTGGGEFSESQQTAFQVNGPMGEGEPFALLVNDFNHDGVDDLAADIGVAVMLLFGDTVADQIFNHQQTVQSGALVSAGDFNGDNVVDLAGMWWQSGFWVVYGSSLPNAPLAGDADGDGQVGFADFLVLSKNFGKVDAAFADGDFDGDGVVTFEDFLILSQKFGTQNRQGRIPSATMKDAK